MNSDFDYPCIGQWYLRRDTLETFRVTGIDGDTEAVEVQTFEGVVNEIDMETWSGLPLELAEPPEDWCGPVDFDIDEGDYTSVESTRVDGEPEREPFRW